MNRTPEDAIFDTVPAWQGFVGAAFVIPIYLIFAYFGHEGRGWVAAVSVISIGASTRICWPLSHRIWFWLTISIILLVHIAIIMIPSWSSEGYPSVMLWPYAIADIAIILGVVAALNKFARLLKWP